MESDFGGVALALAPFSFNLTEPIVTEISYGASQIEHLTWLESEVSRP